MSGKVRQGERRMGSVPRERVGRCDGYGSCEPCDRRLHGRDAPQELECLRERPAERRLWPDGRERQTRDLSPRHRHGGDREVVKRKGVMFTPKWKGSLRWM